MAPRPRRHHEGPHGKLKGSTSGAAIFCRFHSGALRLTRTDENKFLEAQDWRMQFPLLPETTYGMKSGRETLSHRTQKRFRVRTSFFSRKQRGSF